MRVQTTVQVPSMKLQADLYCMSRLCASLQIAQIKDHVKLSLLLNSGNVSGKLLSNYHNWLKPGLVNFKSEHVLIKLRSWIQLKSDYGLDYKVVWLSLVIKHIHVLYLMWQKRFGSQTQSHID